MQFVELFSASIVRVNHKVRQRMLYVEALPKAEDRG
jgi:hypothetical protein